MVIFLQLCLFLVAVSIRGRFLFGWHLRASEAEPERLEYIRRGKHGIEGRHIGMLRPQGIPFIIRRERWYHRLLKTIGIAAEIQIPDAEFDRNYLIITDFPHHLQQAVRSNRLLEHLRELFALPIHALYATPDRMWCLIKSEDLQKSPSHFSPHIGIMCNIAACTSGVGSQGLDMLERRNLSLISFFFICVHAGLLTLGILGALPTLADSIDTVDDYAWIAKGLAAGGIAAAMWFALILYILRGSSWICWVMVDFLLCGIVGFALSGIFVVREVNTHWAQSPPTIYVQPIIKRECELKCKKRCGKHCTLNRSFSFHTDIACTARWRDEFMRIKQQTDHVCHANAWYEYNLTINHWREASTYNFAANQIMFDQTRTHSLLNVPVNEGALGLEWVDIEKIKAQ